jgi:hypothetical protein
LCALRQFIEQVLRMTPLFALPDHPRPASMHRRRSDLSLAELVDFDQFVVKAASGAACDITRPLLSDFYREAVDMTKATEQRRVRPRHVSALEERAPAQRAIKTATAAGCRVAYRRRAVWFDALTDLDIDGRSTFADGEGDFTKVEWRR